MKKTLNRATMKETMMNEIRKFTSLRRRGFLYLKGGVLSALCVLASSGAQAQTSYTWTSTSSSWDTPSNWTSSPSSAVSPGQNGTDLVFFGSAFTGTTITTTVSSASYSLNNFTYTAPSGTASWTIRGNRAGGSVITIGGTLSSIDPGLLNSALTFTDGSSTNSLSINVANVLVSGQRSILAFGDSTVGISNINVTGGSQISGGTSSVSASLNVNLDKSSVTHSPLGSANLGVVTFGSTSVANSGLNNLNLNNASTTGTNSSLVTVTGLQTAYFGGTYTSGTETVNGYGGSRPGVDNVTLAINTTGSYDTNAHLQDQVGTAAGQGSLSVVKVGAGRQTLNGSSSYSGSTAINAGTLIIGNANALGYGATVYQTGGIGSGVISGVQTVAPTVVNSGGSLDLNGQTLNSEHLNMSGGKLLNGSATAASVSNGVAGITFAGSPTNLSTSSVPTVAISGAGAGASAVAVQGLTLASVSMSGGTGYAVNDLISVSGAGSTSSAYYVVTSVSGGAITGVAMVSAGQGFGISPGAAITFTKISGGGSGATMAFNNGTLQVVGIRMTAAGSGYTSTPTVTVNGTTISASAVLSGITLASGTSSSFGGLGNLTIAGIIDGGGALNKVDSNTVTLTGSNTYTGGTTVTSGTLVASSLGAGDVTVGTGVLTLTSTDAINLAASLTIDSTSMVNLNFSGTNSIESLSLDGGLTMAQMGTWGALGSGATNTSSLFAGTGVLFIAVPEPSVAFMALMGLGVLALAARQTRRRRSVESL